MRYITAHLSNAEYHASLAYLADLWTVGIAVTRHCPAGKWAAHTSGLVAF